MTPISIDQAKDLLNKKLITLEQYKSIIDVYHGSNDLVQSKKFTLEHIITYIGAGVLGLGIMLWMATNRDTFLKTTKTLILIGAMLASYIAGYLIMIQSSHSTLGKALIFLGTMIYGANIFLIGQMYNLGGTYYEAFGLRALGILPFIYLHIPIIFFKAYILLLVYIRFLFNEIPLMNQAPLFIPLSFSLIGLITLTGSWMIDISDNNKHNMSIQKFLRTVGLRLAALGFFPLIRSGLLRYDDTRVYSLTTNDSLMLGGLILTAIISRLVVYYMHNNKKTKNHTSIMIHLPYIIHTTTIVGIIGLLLFVPGLSSIRLEIFFNMYFFVMALAVINHGLTVHKNIFVKTGLFFIFMQLMVKYFDLFYSMEDRALFFMIGGGLLLIIGYLIEQRKQKLIASTKKTIS